MKGELIVPEPVEKTFVLTKTETEAAVLKKILVKTRGNSTVVSQMKDAMSDINSFRGRVSVRIESGYIMVNETVDNVRSLESEW